MREPYLSHMEEGCFFAVSHFLEHKSGVEGREILEPFTVFQEHEALVKFNVTRSSGLE